MTDNEPDDPPFVVIPLDRIREDLLLAIIEEFIGREGTDYGEREVTWEGKIADVQRQLRRKEAHVVFDPGTETTTILTTRELRERQRRLDTARSR